jgi:hypothetical protein
MAAGNFAEECRGMALLASPEGGLLPITNPAGLRPKLGPEIMTITLSPSCGTEWDQVRWSFVGLLA